MALPVKVFKGKINGKNAYTYTSQLDYSLKTYEERLKLVEKILENDDFFVKYFDKYHKVNVNKEDFLSLDRNVCKAIEKIADYLLFSPDKKEKNKIKYVFYQENWLKDKMKKEKSLETIVDKSNHDEEVIMFLIDKSKNFRKEAKQAIFESDYKDIEIGHYLTQYRNVLNYFVDLLKNDKTLDFKQKKKIKKLILDMKTDCIILKDKLKGTIYYNHCLPETEDIKWWMVSFTNPNHVLALLKMPNRSLIDDLGIIIYDFNQLLKQIELNQFEERVIELWRMEDNTQEDIANELQVSQQFISATLMSISKKIVNQYKENYEDWIYLNWKKGTYKQCSKCGQIKLISKFGMWSYSKDGHRPECKKCRKE